MDFTDKLPPQDLNCEKAVLGCILIDNTKADILVTTLTELHFYTEVNRLIFRAIVEMHKQSKPIDEMLLISKLKTMNLFTEIGSPYIMELTTAVTTIENFAAYLENIVEAYHRRCIIMEATEAISESYSSTKRAYDIFKKLEKLNDLFVSQEVKGTSADDINAITNEVTDYKNRGNKVEYSTAFDSIDELTGGFHRGELWIVGAIPGVGKTALATKMALFLAIENHKTLFMSMEMDGYSLRKRIYALYGLINVLKMRMPWYLSPEDIEVLKKTITQFQKLPFIIKDTPSPRINEVLRTIYQVKPEIVFVDFLQLFTVDKRFKRHEEIGDIAWELKKIARKLSIPVIGLSQLSRENTRRGEMPKQSDLKDSGRLEESADTIFLLHPQATDKEHLVKVIIDKNRHGPVALIDLVFSEDYLDFKEQRKE